MRTSIIIPTFFFAVTFTVLGQEKNSLEYHFEKRNSKEINNQINTIAFENEIKVKSKTQIFSQVNFKNNQLSYPLSNNNLYKQLTEINNLTLTTFLKYTCNKKWKITAEAKPVINFEKKFNISNTSMHGGIMVSYLFNSLTAIEVGVKRSNALGKSNWLPQIAIQHDFSKSSNLSLGFPKSSFRYSNNPRNAFFVKNIFEGNSYKLDNLTQIIVASEIKTSFEYERNVDSNWFLHFIGGYGFNRKFEIRDEENKIKYQFKNTNGILLGIGLKYKY